MSRGLIFEDAEPEGLRTNRIINSSKSQHTEIRIVKEAAN
jgi:hypothetical protein